MNVLQTTSRITVKFCRWPIMSKRETGINYFRSILLQFTSTFGHITECNSSEISGLDFRQIWYQHAHFVVSYPDTSGFDNS